MKQETRKMYDCSCHFEARDGERSEYRMVNMDQNPMIRDRLKEKEVGGLVH